MNLFRIIAAVVLGLFVMESHVLAADPVRALMLTQSMGYTHGAVNRMPKNKPARDLAPAEVAMIQLGQQTGLFEVHCTQNAAADFTKDNLKDYDIVMFYTTLDLPIADVDKDYFFKEWLPTKGHGFIGFHSALDTFHEYEPYWDMVGGTFDGHPWGSSEEVTITVHDQNHPAMRPFGAEFKIKDEIYWYRHWQPEKVRVLMSLNLEKCKTKGATKDGVVSARHVPVSWVKNYGEGKVFVTNLGHNDATWVDRRFLDHVTGGVKWILGLEPGDATPNPEVSAKEQEKALKAAGITQ